MKIVIIGARGRLGSALVRELRGKFDVIGFDRTQLDLGDLEAIQHAFGPLDFDVLVNTAAFTNVDLCEKEPEKAFQINAEAPGALATICREKNARLIHFSTDYVFDGEKREPYSEEDDARPISVYGESKRAGEERVLAAHDRHLVVRVSWVFGPDRPSFVDAIIKRAEEGQEVAAIADKFSTPTYTRDIAQMLPRFFVAGIDAPGKAGVTDPGYSGIIHFANAGECSWQEYGQHALDCCHRAGMALKARQVAPLKLQDMKSFVARRPVYSVLSPARYTSLTGTSPRAWREAVADYILEAYRAQK